MTIRGGCEKTTHPFVIAGQQGPGTLAVRRRAAHGAVLDGVQHAGPATDDIAPALHTRLQSAMEPQIFHDTPVARRAFEKHIGISMCWTTALAVMCDGESPNLHLLGGTGRSGMVVETKGDGGNKRWWRVGRVGGSEARREGG